MSMKKEVREAMKAALIDALGENRFSAFAFASENGVSLQSVYRLIDELIQDGIITKEKKGRKNVYQFTSTDKEIRLSLDGLDENRVWNREVKPFFRDLPEIPEKNLHYAFTEILNNAIDHSGGTGVEIHLRKTAYSATVIVWDDGVGIFQKIAKAMDLEEKRYAILELAKGKFTTEPESHSGEGIFFSSKVVDVFLIFSDELAYMAKGIMPHGLIDSMEAGVKGTAVLMQIKYSHTESSSEVFDHFTQAPEDYGFSKTIVPVRLLEFGDERPQVVSRSQAKRLMVRFERFENILLDFSGIDEIGQGFADELFRVFPAKHPNTKLVAINTNDKIDQMIRRVQNEH